MTLFERDFDYNVERNVWRDRWGDDKKNIDPILFALMMNIRPATVFVCGPGYHERRHAMEVLTQLLRIMTVGREAEFFERLLHLEIRADFVRSVPGLTSLEVKAYVSPDGRRLEDLTSTIAFRKKPDAMTDTKYLPDWVTPTLYCNPPNEAILFGGVKFTDLGLHKKSSNIYTINNRIRERLNIDGDKRPCIRVTELPASVTRVFLQWDDRQQREEQYKDPNIHHERSYDGPPKTYSYEQWLAHRESRLKLADSKEEAKHESLPQQAAADEQNDEAENAGAVGLDLEIIDG